MVYDNILEAIGNTPMIRLSRLPEEGSADVLVKMEALNVGGSIKTRTALNMIEQAEKEGLLDKDTIIVEPTSGNQGIGLALVGAVKGYKTIIIMPDSVSEERRKLVRHYGAEVVLIHDAGDIGACIDECLRTALRMKAENPKVFVPQQFENPNNTMTHKKFTALEIMAQVAGTIDGFCAGIGTGGTITGIGEVLKAQYPDIEIWAVEPENAAILAGGTVGTHLQMGIGDGIIPEILNQQIYSDIPDGRNLCRDQCGSSTQTCEEARQGKDGGDRAAGYSREIFFNAALYGVMKGGKPWQTTGLAGASGM